jgi:hypothetical protein
MQDEIINRVAASKLITFDLEEYYTPGKRMLIDIKDWLYQELVLKEKDFRGQIRQHNWHQYENAFVAITCSADAIVPIWAYMLVGSAVQPYARHVIFGSLNDLEKALYEQSLRQVNWQQYENAKVVIKGCSKVEVPVSIYVEVTNKLRPIVASIMFGEPCSTVPIFKKK